MHPLADAQLGFADEVDGTQFQGAQRRLGAALSQRGDHQHRSRSGRHQLFQKGQAIHAGHFYIQGDDIRRMFLDQLARHVGIRRHANQLQLSVGLNDFAQQAANQRRIIDHQDLDWHFAPNSVQKLSSHYPVSAQQPSGRLQ
ncbi:hypothetical protein D3C84_986280 [compost metagenome]